MIPGLTTQYTEGDWHVDRGSPISTVLATSDDKLKTLVAVVWDNPMETGESVPNARLISAAPDLLAALHNLMMSHYSECSAKNASACPLCREAIAAIEKATGTDDIPF